MDGGRDSSSPSTPFPVPSLSSLSYRSIYRDWCAVCVGLSPVEVARSYLAALTTVKYTRGLACFICLMYVCVCMCVCISVS